MKPHQKGILLTGTGVLLISPDAAFIRLIGVPAMDLLFWRGTMVGLVMCLVILLRERGDLPAFIKRFSWAVVLAAAISVGLNFLFIVGITHTSAASALAILAATPLFAAVIGRLFLGERLSWFTWTAALAVLALIAGIAGDALAQSSGVGVVAALGTSIALAAYFTVFRVYPDISRLQVFAIAGAIGAMIAATLGTPFDFTPRQMSLTLVLTVLIMPVSTVLMTMGPRYLPAAEVSLLILLESVFGPLWVLFAVGEVPSPITIACGAAILVTVGWHAVMTGRRERRAGS
jgi:drug/metabolite transporter (DMT)-like permease